MRKESGAYRGGGLRRVGCEAAVQKRFHEVTQTETFVQHHVKLIAPAAERVANDDNDHNRTNITPTRAPLAVLCLSYINEGPSDGAHESVRSPYGSVYKQKRCSAARRSRLPAGEPQGSQGSSSEAGHGLYKNQHREQRGQKWWSTSRSAAHGTHSYGAAYEEGA